MKTIRISSLTVMLLASAVSLAADAPAGGTVATRALAKLMGTHPAPPTAAAAAAAIPVNPRFKQVRDKIAVLFHSDVVLSPVNDPKANPFRIGSGSPPPALGGGAVPAQGPGADLGSPAAYPGQEPAASPSEDQLKRLVGGLRVGGVSVLNGVARISINGTPHRQGDFVKAGDPANPTWLQIVRITPSSVTFQFRDAVEDSPIFTLRM